MFQTHPQVVAHIRRGDAFPLERIQHQRGVPPPIVSESNAKDRSVGLLLPSSFSGLSGELGILSLVLVALSFVERIGGLAQDQQMSLFWDVEGCPFALRTAVAEPGDSSE